MAGRKGQKYDIGPPTREFLRRGKAQKSYFFVDSKLYKTLWSSRPQDLLRAWCYNDERVVDFVWSDVKRKWQQAYDTIEVSKLINRQRENIFKHLSDGEINKPIMIHNKNGRIGTYKWSEDDVLALYDYYMTVAIGRPRKDGSIAVNSRMPTRLELIALMKQNKMVYVQSEDGEFVPIFDAPDWT